MPSAFTHMLVGAAVAQIAPAETSRGRAAIVLATASAIPDLDVVAFTLGIPYSHMLGHRGLSHSLLFAAVLAVPVALVIRQWSGARQTGLVRLWLVGFLAVALHGVLDVATDAGLGIGLLIPFSGERFFLPFRPIATSPVNPIRFLDSRSIAILASEMVWVWVPLGVLSGLLEGARWWRRASARGRPTGSE